MSIISISDLKKELDDDTTDFNKLLTKSVNRATSFVNTYTAKYHYPFDNYNTVTGVPRAPDDIVNLCTQVSTAMFYIALGEASRDGKERAFWSNVLTELKAELREIRVSPQWMTETVSLSEDIMLLGASVDNHQTYKIIPFNASITGGGSTWVRGTHFIITTGNYLNGLTDTEYINDVWYLYAIEGSSLDGTIHYLRTFRNDNSDYALYSRNEN